MHMSWLLFDQYLQGKVKHSLREKQQRERGYMMMMMMMIIIIIIMTMMFYWFCTIFFPRYSSCPFLSVVVAVLLFFFGYPLLLCLSLSVPLSLPLSVDLRLSIFPSSRRTRSSNSSNNYLSHGRVCSPALPVDHCLASKCRPT